MPNAGLLYCARLTVILGSIAEFGGDPRLGCLALIFKAVREKSFMYAEKVREILAKHSRLDVDVNNLKEDDDLYEVGLTSLTTVNIMLAIEDAFDIEFPDNKLNRKTFNSIESLVEVIEELVD